MKSLLIEDYCHRNGLCLNQCVSGINLRAILHENLELTYTDREEKWEIQIEKVIDILIKNIVT